MKTFTVKNIMDLGPCGRYSRERVTALFVGREALTFLDILDLDIPPQDRIWAVTRLLPSRERRLFACDCAERVLPLFERRFPADNRPRKAIEAARRYARGEATEEELAAAYAAAWHAAGATWAAKAAKAAYWDARAAGAAADAAHWSAWHAADAAHWSAWHAADATDAAWHAADATDAAERKWQVERLKGYVKEVEAV